MDKFRAIVIDDEPSVCQAVQAILETEGIEVVTTTDSVGAVEDIRNNNYDLIISDLKMPHMDGIQLHNKVREMGCTSSFIIMTAYSDLWSVKEALGRGVYDYILKPFTPDDLRVPLRQRLKLLRERKQPGEGADRST
jgi:DNA-binding NtrC family response regulator